jgi:hypothetical protein
MNAIGRLVAVRFLDTRVLKGRIVDFHPNREFFHVEEPGNPSPTRVAIEGLKAIFFIKTLDGNPGHVDKRAFEDRLGTEKKVWIEFTDGEKLAAWANSSSSPRGGFYVFPADEESNMEKAYVFRAAIQRMEEGEAAEAAAREYSTRAEWASASPPRAAGPPVPAAKERSTPPPAASPSPLLLDTRPLDDEAGIEAGPEPKRPEEKPLEERIETGAVGTYRIRRSARPAGRERGEG